MEGRQNCWSRDLEKKDEEKNGRNEESLKRNNIGKTRKDTKWKRGEFVVVESEKTK